MAESLVVIAEVLAPKTPGSDTDYDCSFEIPIYRVGSADYEVDDCFRLEIDSGWECVCIRAGHTAYRAPRIPSVENETFWDGSARFRVRPATTNSLAKHLAESPVWSSDGLTFNEQTHYGQIAKALVSGGVDGTDYLVKVTATFTDDTVEEKYAVIPVRVPIIDISEM